MAMPGQGRAGPESSKHSRPAAGPRATLVCRARSRVTRRSRLAPIVRQQRGFGRFPGCEASILWGLIPGALSSRGVERQRDGKELWRGHPQPCRRGGR